MRLSAIRPLLESPCCRQPLDLADGAEYRFAPVAPEPGHGRGGRGYHAFEPVPAPPPPSGLAPFDPGGSGASGSPADTATPAAPVPFDEMETLVPMPGNEPAYGEPEPLLPPPPRRPAPATAPPDPLLWRGTWVCPGCGHRYPHERGVAFISIIDRHWTTTLGEIVARRRITRRELDAAPAAPALTAEQEARHHEQATGVAGVMDRLFQAAITETRCEVAVGPGTRVLDVGAGMARTSEAWAALGAEVVACDTEAAHLMHLTFPNLHGEREPETLTTANGHFLRSRDPRPVAHDFTRVVTPIHRLPFADGSFDIVFCRSVLHHLDDLAAGVAEMLRVVRPGGLLVACSEPVRSALEREDDYLHDVADKEDGLNEQVPALADYLAALSAAGGDVRVQAWPEAPRFASARWFRRLPLNYHRWLGEGRVRRGRRALALLKPVALSANFYAVRGAGAIARPDAKAGPGRDTLPDFTAAEFAKVYLPESLAASVESFDADTATFAAAQRRLVAAHRLPPAVFAAALAGEKELRIGWRRPMAAAAGPGKPGARWRHSNRIALVPVTRPAGSTRLEMDVAAPAPADTATAQASRGAVLVDGAEIGRFDLPAGGGWRRLSFDLPAAEPDACPVVDVELRHETLIRSAAEGGPPVELGLGVRWIRMAAAG